MLAEPGRQGDTPGSSPAADTKAEEVFAKPSGRMLQKDRHLQEAEAPTGHTAGSDFTLTSSKLELLQVKQGVARDVCFWKDAWGAVWAAGERSREDAPIGV